jgi:plastocyanin
MKNILMGFQLTNQFRNHNPEMNILKSKNSNRLAYVVLFVFLFSNSFLLFLDVNAVPENNPFDDPNQSICYFLEELDVLFIDGEQGKSTIIRDEVNESAHMFTNKTNMKISDESCNTSETNMIRVANFQDKDVDGQVDTFPSDSNFAYKYLRFNTFDNHPYSTETTCFTLSQNPNLQYIANHEFGHFAGLDHITENKDSNNDFMSRNCNPAYATLPQNYANQINSLYPVTKNTIPSHHKSTATQWSVSQITDNAYGNSISNLIKRNIISVNATQGTGTNSTIPSWIKDIATLWHTGEISDDQYFYALEWLINNGVIKLGEYKDRSVNGITPSFEVLSDSYTITMSTDSGTPACTPNCFLPSTNNIDIGDSVRFWNNDNIFHVISSGNAESGSDGKFASNPIPPNTGYTVTFTESGVYNYFSHISPWMEGTITVGTVPTNNPPTSNAGDNQSVTSGSTVILSGSGADPEGGILYYTWKQTSGDLTLLSGSSYAGGSSRSQSVYFTAPTVSSPVTLQFSLTVKDDIQQSTTDVTSITINPIQQDNRSPTANAGADQTIQEGNTATLHGESSSDIDGDTLSYLWEQLGSSYTVTLSDSTISNPTFVSPAVNIDRQLTFKLTIHDTSGLSSVDYTTVIVQDNSAPAPDVNTRPISNAGEDRAVNENNLVTLVGTGSSDADGDSLTYTWDQLLTPGDTTVTLSSSTVQSPTFTAPDITASVILEFRLIVNDGIINSRASVVAITIHPIVIGPAPNIPHVPNPDSIRKAEFGSSVSGGTSTIAVGAPNKDVIVLSTNAQIESLYPELYSFILQNGTSNLDVIIHNNTNTAQIISEQSQLLLEIPQIISFDSANSIPAQSAQIGILSLVTDQSETSYLFDKNGILILTEYGKAGGMYLLDSTTGNKIHTINNPDPASREYFGSAVSINDNIIAVSASDESSAVSRGGAVYLYDSAANLIRKIANPTPIEYDSFGSEIHLGDKLLVGVQDKDPNGITSAGIVHVYSNSGIPLHTINNPEPASYDKFGSAVSMNDNVIIIGAEGNDVSNTPGGSAYLYDDSYSLIQKIDNPTPDYDSFGRTASGHGSDVLIGNPVHKESGVSAGVVYLYHTNGTQLLQINNPYPASGDNFGASLASINNTHILIGVPRDDDANRDSGAAYLFDGTGLLVKSLTNPDSIGSERFGVSVGSSNDNIIIGEPENSEFENDAGAVWMFSPLSYLPDSTIPISNAGIEQTVTSGGIVHLNGNNSTDHNNRTLFYQWVQTDSTGHSITLNDAENSTTSFVTPTISSDVTLKFDLTVNNGIKNSSPDSVSVLVVGVPVINNIPIANAGANQTVSSASIVRLDAGGSYDVDGDVLSSYLWNQTNANYTITLNDVHSKNATFMAPTVNSDTVLFFDLTVNDGISNSIADTVNITVLAQNNPPITQNYTVTTNEDTSRIIVLRGVDSDGDNLTFNIIQTPLNGTLSSITQINSTAASVPYNPAPNYHGTNTITFYTHDGTTNSNNGTITIIVNQINDAPVAINDNYTTLEDIPIILNVLSNDYDVDFVSTSTGATSAGTDTGIAGFVNNRGTFVAYWDNMAQIPDTMTLPTTSENTASAQSNNALLDSTILVHQDNLTSLQQKLTDAKQNIIDTKESLQDVKKSFKSNEITKKEFLDYKKQNKIKLDILRDDIKDTKKSIKNFKGIINDLVSQRELTVTLEKIPTAKELKQIKNDFKAQKAEFQNIKNSFKEIKDNYKVEKESFKKIQEKFQKIKDDYKDGTISKELFKQHQKQFREDKDLFQDVKKTLQNTKESFHNAKSELKISKNIKNIFKNTRNTEKLAIQLSLNQNYTDSSVLDDIILESTDKHGMTGIAHLTESELSQLTKSGIIQSAILPHTPELYSHGVQSSFANLFHAKNVTGSDITVAVIDDSFLLNDNSINNNVKYSALYDSGNRCSGDISCGKTAGNSHGTAVAEIISNMAPDVNLHVYAIGNSVDFANVIDDIISRGEVDIISISLGFPTAGGDGVTGYFRDGTSVVAKKINQASESGIIPVIAVGNDANRHWMGTYTPSVISPDTIGLTNYDSLHQFDSTASGNLKACLPVNSGAYTILSWNAWSSTIQDYDLFLYDSTMTALYASSVRDHENTPLSPIELLQSGNTGCLVVASDSSTQNHKLHIYTVGGSVNGGLAIPAGSISTPADAISAISAGAVHHSTSTLESFSSYGPTDDGRAKPDICGYDGVTSSQSAINPFYGTSAAAPHTSGAIALYLEAYKTSPDTLVDDITISSQYTNQCGAGILSLNGIAAQYNGTANTEKQTGTSNINSDSTSPNDTTMNGASSADSTITISSVGSPSYGTVIVNQNGTITYSPNTDYYGMIHSHMV